MNIFKQLQLMNFDIDISIKNETCNKFITLYRSEMINYFKENGSYTNPIDLTLKKMDLLYIIIKKVIQGQIWKNIKSDDEENYYFNNIKLGDMVKISYYPNSQKYIKFYDKLSVEGIIFFVDARNDNMLLYSKSPNGYINIRSLEVEGCHYFGMTRGYYYDINLI